MSVVVLAKGGTDAKSRLALTPILRRRVATAMLVHTVRTVQSSRLVGNVVVVSDDDEVRATAARLGAHPESEPTPRDMNAAARAGWRVAAAHRPQDAIAVIVADLPLLSSNDIDGAVAEFDASREPLMVADEIGLGTTMLILGTEQPHLHPFCFGAGSALAHRSAGYQPAAGGLRGLRTDLDTVDDLVAAVEELRRKVGAPSASTIRPPNCSDAADALIALLADGRSSKPSGSG